MITPLHPPTTAARLRPGALLALVLLAALAPICRSAAPANGRTLGVSLNAHGPVFSGRATTSLVFPSGPYRCHVPQHRAWNFRFPTASLHDGWNAITVHHDGLHPLDLVCLELAVKKSRSAAKT